MLNFKIMWLVVKEWYLKYQDDIMLTFLLVAGGIEMFWGDKYMGIVLIVGNILLSHILAIKKQVGK